MELIESRRYFQSRHCGTFHFSESEMEAGISASSGPPLIRRAPVPDLPALRPGNVVIDNCTECDLIWLGFGETKQIVEAHGRDRGGRQISMNDEDVRSGALKTTRTVSVSERPTTWYLVLRALFDADGLGRYPCPITSR